MAKQLIGAVVINADASQVYSDLAILSARPMPEEMDGVTHRLFGHVDGATPRNAAAWAAEARTEIASAHASSLVPILVGGTGLYLRTLLDGIAPIPGIDPQVRAEVRALPLADAFRQLQQADPVAAASLRPTDTTRVARALEVIRATGTALHIWQQQRIGGIGHDIALTAAVLLPPRDWLRARCDARLVAMFAAGARGEVERLLARGLDPDLPAMRAIGVPQIAAWLRGDCSEADSITLAQAATRQYAKRQYSWFRNQSPDDWQRIEESLSVDNISHFAIKLRESLLTG